LEGERFDIWGYVHFKKYKQNKTVLIDNTNDSEPVHYSFLVTPTRQQISQIVDLYRMADWWSDGIDDPDQIPRLITGSHCYAVACIKDKIIGIGRAISDGVSDAYIQDITVDESFRRRGIASRIVEELIHRLHEDGLYWIGLIAERGTHEFYKRFGFKVMENSMPMLRKDT